MGHYFLHLKDKNLDGGFKDTIIDMSALKDGAVLYEQDANAFAMAILMPEDLVRRRLQEIGDEGSLAEYFVVPLTVMDKRLREIGCVG